MGRLDADGFLRITGRKKDIIIRKGENISARELEDLIAAHPAIAEVAVIGAPDPVAGEIACAVVRLQPDAPTLTLGAQTLRGLSAEVWNSYLEAAGYPRESRLPANYQYPAATPLTERREAARVAPPPPRQAARAEPAQPPAAAPPPAGTIRF